MISKSDYPFFTVIASNVYPTSNRGKGPSISLSGHASLGKPLRAEWITENEFVVYTEKGFVLEYNNYLSGPKIVGRP